MAMAFDATAAVCQQHPQLLTAQRLHMHRTIKPHTHHLRDAAGVVAVCLVDLGFQNRPHVPRLDTDHRKVRFSKSAEQPLRQWSSFQSEPLEVIGGTFQHRQQCFGSLATFTSRTISPVSSTMQTLVSLTETSSPAKCSMLRFSF